MAEEKQTEGQRFLRALEKTIVIVTFTIIFAWLLGIGHYFAGMVSTMGFALIFLFLYATR